MSGGIPVFDQQRCLACARCLRRCPEGALYEARQGWRILFGGHLGRRPRLALPMPGLYDERAVGHVLAYALDVYKQQYHGGVRFGTVIREHQKGLEAYVQSCTNSSCFE